MERAPHSVLKEKSGSATLAMEGIVALFVDGGRPVRPFRA